MKSVVNVVAVLKLFSDNTRYITVSTVSEYLRIPKSSSSRLLSAMREGGLLHQDYRGGSYQLGFLARRIGFLYSNNNSVRETIRAGMQELASEIRHSCWMSVLSGADIVVLDRVHGGYPVRLVVEEGSRLPAHATAAGKALLARLSDEQVRAIFESSGLPSFTARTVTSIERLLEELAVIRNKRWAESRQEVIDGIKSVAVGLSTAGEGSDVALSVSFPIANVHQAEQRNVRQALLRTAATLGQRIGDPRWCAQP